MSYAPIARIMLRYLSGALIMKGLDFGDLSADPDLVMYVGLALGACTEAAYAMAVKFGWAK